MVKLLHIEIYDSLVEAKVSDENAGAAAQSITPTSQLATKADVVRIEVKIDMLI